MVGLAIGFGAQSLVKDYFTGFFILMEDQIRTGDVVKVADIGGLVEDVTLRHVRLRDYDGNLHFVPNSLVTTVTNMSRTYAQAVIDIGVAYREDVDRVLDVMREVGEQLRADPGFGPRILDNIEIAGVEHLADSAVILGCRFKVRPLEQWNVRREYLRRIKAAFDAKGIEIPYPHLTLYAGSARPEARRHRRCDWRWSRLRLLTRKRLDERRARSCGHGTGTLRCKGNQSRSRGRDRMVSAPPGSFRRPLDQRRAVPS